MSRRILSVLESRSTYGYAKNVMAAIDRVDGLDNQCLVTGMHLIAELGNSVDLIRTDGLPIAAEVPFAASGTGKSAWARALGDGIAGFAEALERLRPDIVVLYGDRIETFGVGIAASYMNVPTAHVQAGDKSGHIDDIARMAMAKLCHVHLASCADSAERLRRLGEQEFRIFNVGAPQLDDIVNVDFSAESIVLDAGVIDLKKQYILLVQHPLMIDSEQAGTEMQKTLNACLKTGLPIIWIYPNSDKGSDDIVLVANHFRGSDIKIIRNAERSNYLALLANCSVLVGNSSSGILEAPSFKVPVVNIGDRQRGRPQASNITNAESDEEAIYKSICFALYDDAFGAACDFASNPYGDGHSGERIAKILSKIELSRTLLDKQTIY